MSNGTCQDCGSDRWKLHRHHIKPKSQGGSDDPSNLAFICSNCHEDRHGPSGESEPWRLAQTPEARAKQAQSMRLRWTDPGYRERVMAARQASYRDPEVSRKKSEGVKRAIANKTPEELAEWGRRVSATKSGRSLKGDRWSMAYDECRGCHSTDRKHVGDGFCSTCYYRARRDQPLGPVALVEKKPKRWAKFFDACLGCGTTEREHVGHGLCESCRSNKRRGHLTI